MKSAREQEKPAPVGKRLTPEMRNPVGVFSGATLRNVVTDGHWIPEQLSESERKRK